MTGNPETVVAVEGLVRHFGATRAVDDIHFTVGRGEIFGFLGPNGAGKSTTINVLCTLLLPTSGRAAVNGFDVVRQPAQVRRSIGLVFQDPSLDDRLTAEENLELHAMLYGLGRQEGRRRADALLAMVELADRRRHLVRTYSGGMKRRLEIARGLLHAPAVLFLDEPTLGLDPQTRARIWEYVRALRDDQGVTVFMTTHYMDEAEHCDRIAIIDHGRLQACDTPAELKRMVGGDVVLIAPADGAADLAAAIGARYGLAARPLDGRVLIEVADGHRFVPRLAADFPEQIAEVQVRRPTLDDVFLKLTGRAIREEDATARDRMRLVGRMWRRP